MKKLRGLLIAVMLGIVTLMLAGCNAGSSVDTALTIQQDLSGTRVMDIAIVESVFNDNFSGTPEDLYALIEAKCPQELTWAYAETEEAKTYTFTLAFSSLEDYQTKVAALCGEEKEITVNVADSIWSNGVFVQESFTSRDLLKWLSDALVEVEYVSEGNASKIFSDGETTVSFGSDSFKSGSTIYWDNISYLKLNSITVKTDVASVDVYKMRVEISVPAESMDAKGTEIKEFINNCVPALGKLEEEEKDGDTIFTIVKEPVDMAGMENFLTTVFGEGNASAVQNLEGIDATHPFIFRNVVDQKISLRNYMAGNNSNARFRYLIKAPENITVLVNSSKSHGSDDDYTVMADYYVSNDEMNYSMDITKTYQMKEMTVKTTQKAEDKWEKVTTFQYDTLPTTEDLQESVARFEKRLNPDSAAESEGNAENTAKKTDYDVKVKSSDKEGYSITVTQKGSSQDIAESGALLYGRANGVVYANEGGFAKVTKKQAIVDECNYNSFLNNATALGFVMHYNLKIKGISKIIDTNINETNMVEQKSASVAADFNGPSAKVEVYGSYTDLMAVLFWVLLVAGILLILLAILKSGILGKKKDDVTAIETDAKETAAIETEKEEATVSAEQPVIEDKASEVETNVSAEETGAATETKEEVVASVEENETAAKVAFCEKCGAKLEEGAAFCENCGTKIS